MDRKVYHFYLIITLHKMSLLKARMIPKSFYENFLPQYSDKFDCMRQIDGRF